MEIMKMFVPCAELIWIGKLNSTYCMREKGHLGEHMSVLHPALTKIECEHTPFGVSWSENKDSYYFRIRDKNTIRLIRITKDDINWEVHNMENQEPKEKK